MAKFKCCGCGKIIQVKTSNPKQRRFTWTDTRTKERKPYCYDCDGKLIDGTPLPNGFTG